MTKTLACFALVMWFLYTIAYRRAGFAPRGSLGLKLLNGVAEGSMIVALVLVVW